MEQRQQKRPGETAPTFLIIAFHRRQYIRGQGSSDAALRAAINSALIIMPKHGLIEPTCREDDETGVATKQASSKQALFGRVAS
jgi:hypothetical protein|tara:strand:+ start:641 stop:892 length:252 start_codon:yes stop_codon:yes gene_type:complete